MTPEEIDAAIVSLQLAITNDAMLDGLIGHGPSQANRDVKLGLTAEQSKPVLAAIILTLQALKD